MTTDHKAKLTVAENKERYADLVNYSTNEGFVTAKAIKLATGLFIDWKKPLVEKLVG